jgi:hypothetical protein
MTCLLTVARETEDAIFTTGKRLRGIQDIASLEDGAQDLSLECQPARVYDYTTNTLHPLAFLQVRLSGAVNDRRCIASKICSFECPLPTSVTKMYMPRTVQTSA